MRRLLEGAIGIRDLLHHALPREQAGECRASIAPVPPGIVRPILIVGALGRSRVELKACKQQRISLRGSAVGERIVLVALGEARQRVRFAGVRAFLIPQPGSDSIRVRARAGVCR